MRPSELPEEPEEGFADRQHHHVVERQVSLACLGMCLFYDAWTHVWSLPLYHSKHVVTL